jgi:hypothetical protein
LFSTSRLPAALTEARMTIKNAQTNTASVPSALADKLNFFIPIAKVDVAKREVWGVAAEEAPDKSGEIMDYAASKPEFQAWSDSISKATNGASLGNVRAMHQPIAAGKLVSLEFDDDVRKVTVGAKIVDDNEWTKVTEGVYTGFSIGGTYGWQKFDTAIGKTRYQAKPSEISIVDNPCMHGATFQLVRADGASEMHKFAGTPGAGDTPSAPSDAAPDDPALAKLAGDIAALAATLTKSGARHSAGDMQMLQSIHDSAMSLGAACAVTKADEAGALRKDGTPADDDDPEFLAFIAHLDVSSIADALKLVSAIASNHVGYSADVSSKLMSAVQILTSALSDRVSDQATATQAAAIDAAQDASDAEVVDLTGESDEPMQAITKDDGGDDSGGDDGDMQQAAKAAPVASVSPSTEDDMNKDITEQLNKFQAELITQVKEILSAMTTPLQKMNGTQEDMSKRFDAVAAEISALSGRITKIEITPVGVGPVLREVGMTATNGEDALMTSLDELIKIENDPTIRQALQQRRTNVALKAALRTGNRIG